MASESKSKSSNNTNTNKNTTKRKQRYFPFNTSVVPGFFITCDGGRERQAFHESIIVINSAISRPSTLFEMIRDYEQATMDLQRLVSLLMKQVEDKANQSGASDRMSSVNELRQAEQWFL
ncbi:hypothetical protein CsSME_00042046 [Camellia sinensis var. sinensis]